MKVRRKIKVEFSFQEQRNSKPKMAIGETPVDITVTDPAEAHSATTGAAVMTTISHYITEIIEDNQLEDALIGSVTLTLSPPEILLLEPTPA